MVTILAKQPPSPFCILIPPGNLIGRKFTILGAIRKGGEKISINLQNSRETFVQPQDDVPFHIEVRPNQGTIARNSFSKNQWDSEERSLDCPIEIGKFFEIIILIERFGFRVAINGNHFCNFNNRLSLVKAKYLHIYRDSDIKLVSMESKSDGINISYPYPKPTYEDVNNPYITTIKGGELMVGYKVLIRGKSMPSAKRISINLQQNNSKRIEDINAKCDVPLHIDVRFPDNVIVRNHFQNYQWYHEERFGGCPIGLNQLYEIEILVELNHYTIKINGVQFCTFYHRLNFREVKYIVIRGDTSLDLVSCIPARAPPINVMRLPNNNQRQQIRPRNSQFMFQHKKL